ncbi:DUF3267 domain-containing protein [Sporosarcina sp. 179-K 3D1 HS]|uniref:DUF3267 domain-containing protein n=1 Tax=Sporosarcina sp. 179-K 3D1 HS TaxID=3232169 RepID=UPI0039A01653
MDEQRKGPDHIVELDLPKVAKFSMILTGLSLVILFVIKAILDKGISIQITLWNTLFFIVGYIILIVLHELFHLLGFRLFGHVPWKRMIVGVNLKMGVAYATTDQLMTNRAIRKALLLPFWTTGVLPAIFGIAMSNGLLLGLAAFLIGGAAGDFVMYQELRKLPDDWLVKDDPQMPKLYLYTPERRGELEG